MARRSRDRAVELYEVVLGVSSICSGDTCCQLAALYRCRDGRLVVFYTDAEDLVNYQVYELNSASPGEILYALMDAAGEAGITGGRVACFIEPSSGAAHPRTTTHGIEEAAEWIARKANETCRGMEPVFIDGGPI